MEATFNLGIGMIAVVSAESADAALALLGRTRGQASGRRSGDRQAATLAAQLHLVGGRGVGGK